MRTLIASVLSLLLISSCGMATENTKAQPQKSLTTEEKIIKALLNPLKVKGIEVEKIEPTEAVKVPGFKTYEVTMIDKRRHREIKRYIFMTPDGKYLTLEIFKVRREGDVVHLTPLRPKNAEKPLKVDLSWVKQVDKALTEHNVPHVVGKGDKKVYIVWDIFCPFCYEHFNQIEELAKKNGVEIHLIPFPIHGENSIKGLVVYTQMARKEGAAGALKELYRMGNGSFMVYAKKMEERIKKEEAKVPGREKLEEFFTQLREQLAKNGVRATPSIIYMPPNSGGKGYIYIGFKPIDQVINGK
ncbi:DsbA family protein [Thermovibrio ammonificans]|jgi:thiol:disulfide interchange protein DsbC|uniref:DSBA-like thioredoxin domain-containing protein n=1 Tax=Thermovibrio ammonificans (strain DSM 15698 / JCM 12110 / HB-1) TaxID=648996 RepID=E8T5C8_THEA1|nr:DsbA family protein [Thermovibrio ammonificans]ADU97582.1 hypothetical protein Theam_1626 [Thermovibrio ammonificans HB-1]